MDKNILYSIRNWENISLQAHMPVKVFPIPTPTSLYTTVYAHISWQNAWLSQTSVADSSTYPGQQKGAHTGSTTYLT